MFAKFYPSRYVESAYLIPYEKLYAKGYRGIIFDIDNTLVPHGAPADERSAALFLRLENIGFSCCLLSNNGQERVELFKKDITEVHSIHKAGKPKIRNYKRAMELMGTDTSNTFFVGDQLFTDVWGAKRAGLFTILAAPMNPKEEIQIVLKRRLEYFVIREYRKKRLKTAAKKFDDAETIADGDMD